VDDLLGGVGGLCRRIRMFVSLVREEHLKTQSARCQSIINMGEVVGLPPTVEA
jgi:hypothetical protein